MGQDAFWSTFKAPAVFFILLVTSGASYAGCGEEDGGMCYYYESGELKDKGRCSVTVCSNSSMTNTSWTWKKNKVGITYIFDSEELFVNGKPGFNYPPEMIRKGFDCVGVIGSDEMTCLAE